MTPFGLKLRELRAARGITQKEMAAQLEVSAAYLSALERGHRGIPSWHFLQRVIGYFNIIWDEAEELQKLAAHSHTRVVVDTEKLGPNATRLANFLSFEVSALSEDNCNDLCDKISEKLRERK